MEYSSFLWRDGMPDALREALALYLSLASLETIRQTLELVRGELAQRGVCFHFALGGPPAGSAARCDLPGAGDPG